MKMAQTEAAFMSQFYVTDERSVQIAKEAVFHLNPVSMSGTIGTGVRMFTGIVQSVKEDKAASPKRWRITIRD
jgi:hypothetical protein